MPHCICAFTNCRMLDNHSVHTFHERPCQQTITENVTFKQHQQLLCFNTCLALQAQLLTSHEHFVPKRCIRLLWQKNSCSSQGRVSLLAVLRDQRHTQLSWSVKRLSVASSAARCSAAAAVSAAACNSSGEMGCCRRRAMAPPPGLLQPKLDVAADTMI